MADAPPAAAPPTDDKAHYETLKKELLQALPKKRAIDKQLVRRVAKAAAGTHERRRRK